MTVPSIVFIVPYRNRPQQKFFFCKHMSFILENEPNYEVYIVHQTDNRPFNRGAIKNIGFMAIREKYKENEAYKNITFVFNDIDTMPFINHLFSYQTTVGIVKHFYGFTYALGGIVSITGADFERINGFPCLWGWGHEDNELQNRCIDHRIYIDRSTFFKIGSPEVLQLFDGMTRIIQKKKEMGKKQRRPPAIDGIHTIHNLFYLHDNRSTNVKDNIYVYFNPRFSYINVMTFETINNITDFAFHNYDLRQNKITFANPSHHTSTHNVAIQPESWSDSI